jgi:hypothetical protein
MTEPKLPDPFALVRDLLSQLEKGVNEYAGPVMKSAGFARGTNSAMAAAMTAKKLAQELSQRYFEALNIPSRSDFLALMDRMQVLEDRMINMQGTLDRLAGGANRPALPAPARTRKPPAPVVEAAATPVRAPAPAPRRARRSRS